MSYPTEGVCGLFCSPFFGRKGSCHLCCRVGRGRGAWKLAGQHPQKGRGRGGCLGRQLPPLGEKGFLLFPAEGDGKWYQGGRPQVWACSSWNAPLRLRACLRVCPMEIWTVGQARMGEVLLTFLRLCRLRASGSPHPLNSSSRCHPHLWAFEVAEAGCSPCSLSPLRLLGCGTNSFFSILSGGGGGGGGAARWARLDCAKTRAPGATAQSRSGSSRQNQRSRHWSRAPGRGMFSGPVLHKWLCTNESVRR